MTYLLAMLSLAVPLTTLGANPMHLSSAYGDGVTDAGPGFNKAIARVCRSRRTRTLRIPVGRFVFRTAPSPIPCAVNIIGEGPAVTHLIRDNAATYFLRVTGGQDQYGGGSIRDLKLLTTPDWHHGVALTIEAQYETDDTISSYNPHGFLVDNVLIGRDDPAGGAWNYGIYLDGSGNQDVPDGVAPGIRYVRIRSSSVAAATYHSYLFWYSHNTQATMVDCWATDMPDVYYLNSVAGYTWSESCVVVRR